MRRASRAALLIVAGFLSGCGTIANLEVGAREGWKNALIYGGVRRDVQSAGDWFTHSWTPPNNFDLEQDIGAVVGVGLVGIDVPLSAIGDTLTLPITIPAAIWGSARNAANVSRKKASPSPAAVSNPASVSSPSPPPDIQPSPTGRPSVADSR